MARAFETVTDHLRNIKSNELQTVGYIMKQSAIALMSSSEGSASILYATAFLRMASVFQNERFVNAAVFEKALQKAVEGLKQRGNVSFGDKTLVDVWIAVTDLFAQSNEFPQPNRIDRVAFQAMESTKDMKAKKGKAHIFDEKSVGNIDPGAASSYYLFASLAETFEEKMNE